MFELSEIKIAIIGFGYVGFQSQADVRKAKQLLAYEPTHAIKQGIASAMPWYINFLSK